MKTSFKNFLRESSLDNSDDISASEAAEMISTRCVEWKKYVGDIKKNLIYRGMRVHFAPDFVVKYPRSARRPLTTDKNIHAFADKYFDQKFGKKFRSTSVFAVRDIGMAKFYGDVYAIFPLDRVSFAWSEEVQDFTLSSEKFKNKTVGTFEVTHSVTEAEIFSFMDGLKYHCNDDSLKEIYFKGREYSEFEVMIHCDEYLAIRQEALPAVLNLLD